MFKLHYLFIFIISLSGLNSAFADFVLYRPVILLEDDSIVIEVSYEQKSPEDRLILLKEHEGEEIEIVSQEPDTYKNNISRAKIMIPIEDAILNKVEFEKAGRRAIFKETVDLYYATSDASSDPLAPHSYDKSSEHFKVSFELEKRLNGEIRVYFLDGSIKYFQ